MSLDRIFTRHFYPTIGIAFISLWLVPSVHAANNIAVASLVGDKVTVVRSSMQTGSHLDTNKKYAVALPADGIDGDILLIMQSTVTQQCANCKVSLLKAKTPDTVEGGESLLPSLLGAARNTQAERLVVLTKYRSDARIKLQGGSIVGQGKLFGLGFYTESRPSGTPLDENEYQQGYLAPFATSRFL
jgi:hypothetical protein